MVSMRCWFAVDDEGVAISKVKKLVLDKGCNIHMVGVCGVGMAGLALLLKEKGHAVTGCDIVENGLAYWLRDNGIGVSTGHDGSHVLGGVDLVIRSRAVDDDCADIVCALREGVPVVYRGEVLPLLLEGHSAVAVSGTHGKTTVTAFIAQVLRSAGKDPLWFVGAECPAFEGVAGVSSVSPKAAQHIFVLEADESDGTAALYEPDIAVITNIDFDHMEYFADEDDFKNCFRKLIDNTRKSVVYCFDDTLAQDLLRSCGNKKVVSYGVGDGCDVRAVDIKVEGLIQRFSVVCRGERVGEIDLPLPGRHNILNALAACAVCFELGLEFSEIKAGLGVVALPVRRFERVAESGGVVVISDYAHHPSEIKALIETAGRLERRRLIAVFQPHRYTRTLALGADFPRAFEGLDELVLCPVYAASEKPILGGTVYDLYARCRAAGISGLSLSVAESLEQAWGYLRRELREGDVLLVIGAGDVDNIARWAADEMDGGRVLREDRYAGMPIGRSSAVMYDESLGKRTTLGVGGRADVLVDVDSVSDLADLIKWTEAENVPFQILGGGSNMLVSDLGVRGVVGRLTGGEFKELRDEGCGMRDGVTCVCAEKAEGGAHIVAGAGVSVVRLLGWLEERGLSGLEFLEGIPGQTGGVVRMNAGAGGGEICEKVSWIRCLNNEGNELIFDRRNLEWEYRCCKSICDMTVIEIGFCLDKGKSTEEIRAARKERAEKRAWMCGLRSAGSVFKNPGRLSGHRTAGELIDKAGLKGRRVGGARVFEGHGNFIVTDKGANASDVKALIEIVRAEVFCQFDIKLEEEIIGVRLPLIVGGERVSRR